jgi:ABC-type lipoprotein release transport system permease subunit
MSERTGSKGIFRARWATELAEAFSLAVASINQHRFQSGLTLAGIIMGIATVIVVVALIQGLDNTIKRHAFSTQSKQLHRRTHRLF